MSGGIRAGRLSMGLPLAHHNKKEPPKCVGGPAEWWLCSSRTVLEDQLDAELNLPRAAHSRADLPEPPISEVQLRNAERRVIESAPDRSGRSSAGLRLSLAV